MRAAALIPANASPRWKHANMPSASLQLHLLLSLKLNMKSLSVALITTQDGGLLCGRLWDASGSLNTNSGSEEDKN